MMFTELYEAYASDNKIIGNSLIAIFWNVHDQFKKAPAKSKIVYENAFQFNKLLTRVSIPIHGVHDQLAI